MPAGPWAQSVLDMWQDGIDPQTVAYIVSCKTTRRGLLSTLMLGLAALVSRKASAGPVLGHSGKETSCT